jgi:exosome complex component RRP41
MSGYELLSDQGLRADGRRAKELRRIRCRQGVFGQADGSAYLEQGNTKVLAAVYGLFEAGRRTGGGAKPNPEAVLVNCQYSMAVFSTGERKKRPRGDRKSQEMSIHLRQTFEAAIKTELYPRSQIDIFVEVLQADGGNYCACVNAATLALIDAGIPLRDYVTACTASLVEDKPLVDISSLESTQGGPELTVAALPKTGEIVLLEMSQRFHLDHLDKVMEVALNGCKDIANILDKVVRQHVTAATASLDLGGGT